MPKERLHLLLADLTLTRMESLTACPAVNDRWREAFLHGAMAPDLFFYDLPFFRLPALGNRLHQIMGQTAADGGVPTAMAGFLNTREGLANRPWLLGMAHHFLVDLRWHPLIDGYSASTGTRCRSMGLDPRNCHWKPSGWIVSDRLAAIRIS